MFELFQPLPNRQSQSLGRFPSEELCHEKAEELQLESYCVTFYTYNNLIEQVFDTWCFSVE